jgi:uncharacterized protein with PQ loop repeat
MTLNKFCSLPTVYLLEFWHNLMHFPLEIVLFSFLPNGILRGEIIFHNQMSYRPYQFSYFNIHILVAVIFRLITFREVKTTLPSVRFKKVASVKPTMSVKSRFALCCHHIQAMAEKVFHCFVTEG